jgi:pilus assembly protein CpaB
VVIFVSYTNHKGQDAVRVLLPKVGVIAVGTTTVTTTTTTDATTGAQTTEQLPKTLFTLAVNQKDAEKVIYAVHHGELTFGLLNTSSKIKPKLSVSGINLFR